ncbi:hypothetical protein ACWD6Q_02435 [Streptomyces nigra]|uniref:hypothetical protein n=1 Tax=Streptomyces nigra TaxID=1827580 RepID=UPI00365074AD
MAGTTHVGDTEQLLKASRGCSELASLVQTAGDYPRSDLDAAARSLSGANWDGQLGGALEYLATRWMDHQCAALHTAYRRLGEKTFSTWSAYTGAERTNTATFSDAHADIRATFG